MPIDEKLARGLARSEIRKIAESTRAHDRLSMRDPRHPVRAALKPVVFRMETGRAPDAPFRRRVVETVDALYAGHPGTLLSLDKDDEHKNLREVVHISTVDDFSRPLLQVRSFSLDLRPKALRLTEQLLFEITTHALERVHLRCDAQGVRDVLRHLVTDAIGWLWMTRGVAEAMQGAYRRLVFPHADGLALCEIVRGRGSRQSNYDLMIGFECASSGDLSADETSSLRINTYIGPCELHYRQADLRERLIAFRRRHASVFEAFAEWLIAPGHTATVDKAEDEERAQEKEDRFVTQCAEAKRELEEIFSDPDAFKACGDWDAVRALRRAEREAASREERSAYVAVQSGDGFEYDESVRDDLHATTSLVSTGIPVPDLVHSA